MDDQTLSSYFLGGRGPSGSKLKKGFETVSNSIVAKSIQRGKCVISVDKTSLSSGGGGSENFLTAVVSFIFRDIS